MFDVPSKIGLTIDDTGNEVQRLQTYLKKFGYIGTSEIVAFGAKLDVEHAIPEPAPNVFDEKTKQALEKYQTFNGLTITGVLDKDTVHLMLKPRCGCPDIIQSEDVSSFTVVGTKWPKQNLTYRYENFTPDLADSIERRAINNAFNQWASVTPLTFSEVSSGGDIKISYVSGNHGDGHAFDGPSGVLAHAFFPTDGRLHFDEDEKWTDDNPSTGIDLETVALHEIGHNLGLRHSKVNQAVMFASYAGRRRSLHPDDVAGIQSIYGGGSGTNPTKPKLLPISRLESRSQGGEGALRQNDSRHDLVTDLQEILIYLGYDLGSFGPSNNGVDGFFGNATRNAVMKFQRNNVDNYGRKLDVDALVGTLTGEALNRSVEKS